MFGYSNWPYCIIVLQYRGQPCWCSHFPPCAWGGVMRIQRQAVCKCSGYEDNVRRLDLSHIGMVWTGHQLHIIMPLSHCPEIDRRWAHDRATFYNRPWSYKYRAIREAIFWHLRTACLVFHTSALTSWVEEKSLAGQKCAETHCEGSLSYGIRMSILPSVRPSWEYLVKSCYLRI